MQKEQGFIQLIIILALFIVILSLLGVSLSAVFQNKTLRDNFSFVWDTSNYIWQKWLAGPFWVVWDFAWDFFIDLIWEPFLDAMQSFKRGESPFMR